MKRCDHQVRMCSSTTKSKNRKQPHGYGICYGSARWFSDSSMDEIRKRSSKKFLLRSSSDSNSWTTQTSDTTSASSSESSQNSENVHLHLSKEQKDEKERQQTHRDLMHGTRNEQQRAIYSSLSQNPENFPSSSEDNTNQNYSDFDPQQRNSSEQNDQFENDRNPRDYRFDEYSDREEVNYDTELDTNSHTYSSSFYSSTDSYEDEQFSHYLA